MAVSSAEASQRNWPQWVLAGSLFAFTGCMSYKSYEEIAPGVGVPRQSIDDYAEQHGVSREEAKQKLAAELSSPPPADAEQRARDIPDEVTGQEQKGDPVR